MCKRKHRAQLLIAQFFCLASIGIGVGYLTARAFILDQAERDLLKTAASLMARSDAASEEARNVLTAMRATRLHSCSDDELSYFGMLVFRSRYLRDAGRISDGGIDCSIAMGRTKERILLRSPALVQPDGTAVYPRIPVFQVNGLSAVTLQAGGDYVTFSPHLMDSVETAPAHYVITVPDPHNHQTDGVVGTLPNLPGNDLSQNGLGRTGVKLYATVCSKRYYNCVTTYVSIKEAMRIERRYWLGAISSGGLAGTIVAFLILVYNRRHRVLAQQFRRALQKDKLRVVYQPIIDLESRRVVGAEALVRWQDDFGEDVSPEVFIPLAERLGLIGQVTRAVLRQSLRDLGELLRNQAHFRLSINVVAEELTGPDLLPLLEREADLAQVSHQSLAVEITEGSTGCHMALADAISRLREKGFAIYIDDFGTGYSSLSYLRDLSVDAIKIDRSFTRTIGTQAVTVSILPQIIEMADSLGLQIIVEGVETLEQADYLAAGPGHLLVQGWYFGRSMGSQEFCSLFEQAAPSGSTLTISVASVAKQH